MIFDFNKTTDISGWRVVDDGVMGGRSQGSFALNANGNGVFSGTVSLENNGGFSSVRYQTDQMALGSYSKFVLKLKGDGKSYQFRVRSSFRERFSYIGKFETTGKKQTIEIPFATMYPAFRGRTLDLDNYNGETLVEIAFLIGNKKAENFKLEIVSIAVE
ncbi:CIA30 family protein [Spongiivirga citrea]|uniref:CIA30 family protein n=2 Tax=Spongiivirga citrea TaxID=1481457 RepID=A0A6M0CKV9_9FLAO|nr:CIA30 family protein [Spongiivirga citrea]